MEDKNFYEILGVSPNATYTEIKKAYRILAKKHHPDKLTNPTPEQQRYFAQITAAYTVLSDLGKRRRYDETIQGKGQQGQSTRPQYAGYPIFRYDFFTPWIYSFFMGSDKVRSREETFRVIVFNYRTVLVACVGALYFFKFFSAMSGTVVEKQIDTGLFNNIAYHLILKSDNEKERTKRVKPEFYDTIKVGDRIEKHFFSFIYKVNDQEIDAVTGPLFLQQVVLIYLFICAGLFFLDYTRK